MCMNSTRYVCLSDYIQISDVRIEVAVRTWNQFDNNNKKSKIMSSWSIKLCHATS